MHGYYYYYSPSMLTPFFLLTSILYFCKIIIRNQGSHQGRVKKRSWSRWQGRQNILRGGTSQPHLLLRYTRTI